MTDTFGKCMHENYQSSNQCFKKKQSAFTRLTADKLKLVYLISHFIASKSKLFIEGKFNTNECLIKTAGVVPWTVTKIQKYRLASRIDEMADYLRKQLGSVISKFYVSS